VQFFTEIVAQADIKVLGKDSLGLVGSSDPTEKELRQPYCPC